VGSNPTLSATSVNLGTIEVVEIGEIASIHALFVHVAEKMAGCSKRLGEYPTLSARNPLSYCLMILRTVEQVRRVFLVIAGFTLLLAGVVMLVTPGPGMLTIFLGLGLLAAEFVWARRLMDGIKREGGKWRDAVMGQPKE
jgi:hypothetical protein